MHVGLAARLSHSGGGLAVGVEQQLHHIERRPFDGGVVQGQPSVLRNALPGCSAQGSLSGGSGCNRRREGRKSEVHARQQQARAAAWDQGRALSAALAALGSASSSSSITPNGAPLAAA